jgi:hypothetical protein
MILEERLDLLRERSAACTRLPLKRGIAHGTHRASCTIASAIPAGVEVCDSLGDVAQVQLRSLRFCASGARGGQDAYRGDVG